MPSQSRFPDAILDLIQAIFRLPGDHLLRRHLEAYRDEAFHDLNECLRSSLIRQAMHDGADYHTAEDMAQEAFLHFMQLDKTPCDPRRPVTAAGLRTFARRRAVDGWRHWGRRQKQFPEVATDAGDRTPGEGVVEDYRPEARNAAEAAAAREAALETALGQLDPLEREVLRLRYWGKLSRKEIAERLGIRLAKLDRLLASARAKLREMLR